MRYIDFTCRDMFSSLEVNHNTDAENLRSVTKGDEVGVVGEDAVFGWQGLKGRCCTPMLSQHLQMTWNASSLFSLKIQQKTWKKVTDWNLLCAGGSGTCFCSSYSSAYFLICWCINAWIWSHYPSPRGPGLIKHGSSGQSSGAREESTSRSCFHTSLMGGTSGHHPSPQLMPAVPFSSTCRLLLLSTCLRCASAAVSRCAPVH